jgi:hypothetical protein
VAQMYFHYSSPDGMLLDKRGTAVANLSEARDCAMGFVRSLVIEPSGEDWRDWLLYVSDELGEELFTVPFALVLGKPH